MDKLRLKGYNNTIMNVCTLYSGSKGNASLIYANGKHILIDCGGSYNLLKKQLNKLNLTPKDIDAVLITHCHNDHISALSTFMLYNSKVNVYVNIHGEEALYEKLYFDLNTFDSHFTLFDLQIEAYYCHHDVPCCTGFKIFDGKDSIVYVTDTGYVDTPLIEFCKGVKTLVIESNHDFDMLVNGKYPFMLKKRIASALGHLSNDQTAQLLERVIDTNTKNIILAHLSENNNLPDLAFKASYDVLTKLGAQNQIKLLVASQYDISEVV